MIPAKIVQVSFSNMGFVVFLKSPQDPRTLPIFIGAPEAQAIAVLLDRVAVPRPLTHDLFKTALDILKCRVTRVVISELRDNIFYAKLYIESGEIESEIDSRPSDALALALRCAAPIFVAQEVMSAAGVIITGEQTGSPSAAGSRKQPSPEESLKQQLAKAVEEERFEDAARLRDEINKQTHNN